MSDAKKRVPPWVAAEVSKHYGIRKAEIGDGSAGKVKVEGNSIEILELIYTGRMLTPTYFGMTPKAPGANAYTLGTGNTKAAGTNYIPFQRKFSIRSDVEAIKTISVPQMVSSERSAPGITGGINEGLQKRLDHQMGRLMSK